MRRIDISILGDFPPKTYTGISIINSLIKEQLEGIGQNVVVIEESAWQMSSAKKIMHYLTCYFSLFSTLLVNKVRVLYLNIPLTRLGLARLCFVVVFSKLASPKVRIVGHIHRGDTPRFISSSGINKFMLKISLKFFGEVIMLSEKSAIDLKPLNFKGEIAILPNTSILEREGRKVPKSYNGRFICVSNFIRSKGIGELVEAFSTINLKGLKLSILGNVYDHEFFKEIINNASSNISFIANPSREVLYASLKDSDCFVLPSWNEGQPLVILEAMSLGLPIISTNVGDIPTMLGDEYEYLIQPRNADQIANAVSHFDQNDLKNTIGDNLYNRYSHNYSNNLFSKRVAAIFS